MDTALAIIINIIMIIDYDDDCSFFTSPKLLYPIILNANSIRMPLLYCAMMHMPLQCPYPT